MLFLSFQLQFQSKQVKSLHEGGIEPKEMQDGHSATAMQCHAMVHNSLEQFGALFC